MGTEEEVEERWRRGGEDEVEKEEEVEEVKDVERWRGGGGGGEGLDNLADQVLITLSKVTRS